MGGTADLNRIRDGQKLTEKQRIVLGFRPRTVAGYWFWFRYYSAVGRWYWRLWRRLR